MSKIICEVCGTAYPETASQCPICGCVRPADAQGVRPAVKEAAPGGYQQVKGGRYSKSNVRKRNQGKQTPVHSKSKSTGKTAKKDSGSNTGLIITIIVLLLAIIAVITYIVLKFFAPSKDTTPDTIDTSETIETIETTSATIPCEEILLDVPDMLFESEGEVQAIFAVLSPEDTTDELIYESSDPFVAMVDENGIVTAVAPGEATITVTCGSATAQCRVYCIFAQETTEDTTAPVDFRLDRSSITFDSAGASWVIYSGDIPVNMISWYSDDNSVATINNGKVTAVGNGTTNVYAQYEGTTLSCQIICSFSDDGSEGHAGNGGVSEDGGDSSSNQDNGQYQLDNLYSQYDTEVTISVGESFPLRLVDSNGKAVEATWSVQYSSVCTVSGGNVTAVGSGDTYVIATYNGVEYRCLVHVL